MGYCIELHAAKFRIAAANKAKALAAIKGLGARKLAWVDTRELVDASTLQAALEACRWMISEDADGNVVGIAFEGEKLGDDELLFKAIAPFVDDGSYLEILGEEGARWRWIFQDGAVTEKTPTVIW